MDHLVIRLGIFEWNKYRKSFDSKDSLMYSEYISPYLQVHFVYGESGNEIMDEGDFQIFQTKLFNI